MALILDYIIMMRLIVRRDMGDVRFIDGYTVLLQSLS